MENELVKTSSTVNSNGDYVVCQREDGGAIVETVKYGVIRLMADKAEHRVKGVTLARLYALEQKGFKGSVAIRELGMNVPLHQIILMKWEEEDVRTAKDFTRLPTEWVPFTDAEPYSRLVISEIPLWELERSGQSYWYGLCHYSTLADGSKAYQTGFDQIKELLHMRPGVGRNEGFRSVIDGIYRYGVQR